MTRTARRGTAALAVALVALAAGLRSGCTAGAPGGAGPSPSSSAAQRGPAIRVVSPEGGVRAGDEVRLVVRATDDGAPLAGRDATFEVVSGPAEYPGGFETSTTDADGVASSLGLRAEGTGRVTIRVAVGAIRSDVTIDVGRP
ncbi:hypothetical protein RL72_00842 [Microbacterium azadirachtae]|uniref:Big-1 domain-containing protein n=1 Tax=Microbacterium azadirachtae TaxID=582680 RepID=A0A0F0L5I9_9MICO|nr:hypothetical protein [Microbacterium azadirachtae]KJL26786.1 hypothetical protein RL72_00842 [Microbacterium azadirachtae]